jgi:hypothetical protein
MYTVTFKFIEAKNLKPGDYFVRVHPKSDKKNVKQTKKIKGSATPKWDEALEMYALGQLISYSPILTVNYSELLVKLKVFTAQRFFTIFRYVYSSSLIHMTFISVISVCFCVNC